MRTWAVGEGFHALHWNMLGWFGVCTRMVRGLLFRWVVRVVAGDFMLWLGRSNVDRGIGGWVCGAMASCCLVFFDGLCDGAGGDWELSWLWVKVCRRLRVVLVCEGGSCFGLVLGASCVCLLRRVRGVRWVVWVESVRLCMKSVTYVFSSRCLRI